MNKIKLFKTITLFILLFISFALIIGVNYAFNNFVFESNPLSQIVFHLLIPTEGAGSGFIRDIIIYCIIFPFVLSVLLIYLYNHQTILKNFRLLKTFPIMVVLFFIFSVINSFNKIGLKEYIHNITNSSTLYEEEYVDPKQINFEFPDKKRNLIYIFLESVEISDYSTLEGGAFEDNYIPELYQLAEENITFNNNMGYNIFPVTGWTIASMVSHTSGINMMIPIQGNNYISDTKFLQGAYSLGEILEKQGYINELLIGSNAEFGGRKSYFEQHGNYLIHDYDWALENGYVDDFVWWGFEDKKLFELAKKELIGLYENKKPFNLTLLTVDTHHNGGYLCEDCEQQYDIYSLANVLRCSSKQVYDFIEWIKQQEFYDDTTIVIAGDHCSMDPYWAELIGENYDRRAYYTIINPDKNCEITENRIISTVDFYPTTLASLGVKWESDRLGLGTNLFSNTPTLMEKYSTGYIYEQMTLHSNYYDKYILYGQ